MQVRVRVCVHLAGPTSGIGALETTRAVLYAPFRVSSLHHIRNGCNKVQTEVSPETVSRFT